MSNLDYTAHKHLSNFPLTAVQLAIEEANERSGNGRFIVCITETGKPEVLTEFSASVRNDIAETVYDTELGYSVSFN
jgi:hypothetical protein